MGVFGSIDSSIKQNNTIEHQSTWMKDHLAMLTDQTCVTAEAIFYQSTTCLDSSSAFWLGYQVAVQKLFGRYLEGELAAFVVNERRSSQPKHWATQLKNYDSPDYVTVNGLKDFVTAPDQVSTLLVGVNLEAKNCTPGMDELRTSRVCKIPVNANGVLLDAFNGLPVFDSLEKAKVNV